MTGLLGGNEAQNIKYFDDLCSYLKRASGLMLDNDKRYLVESRIAPVMRRAGLSELGQLVRLLEQGKMPDLAQEVVQAMTINETYFFRDKMPFDVFRASILPKLLDARKMQKSLRIWCAASSTGQECYSLSMILEEFKARLHGWRLEILATDLSQAALKKAKEARYSKFEVQRGLTPAQISQFFTQQGDKWQLNEAIRGRVNFKHFNLLDNYTNFGTFDVVFCRNVCIYFDAARKSDVLTRIARILAPDGVLAMGASESVIGLSTKFAPHPKHRSYFVHADKVQFHKG